MCYFCGGFSSLVVCLFLGGVYLVVVCFLCFVWLLSASGWFCSVGGLVAAFVLFEGFIQFVSRLWCFLVCSCTWPLFCDC